MKSQCDVIEEILKREGQIDNYFCIEHRITLRLGARIYDLTQKGYEFETKKVGRNYVYKVLTTPKPRQLSLV